MASGSVWVRPGMFPATMRVIPNSPSPRQNGRTATASSALRPAKRLRARSQAIGTPVSSVSVVALRATRSESQIGKESIARSELSRKHEPEALHDRAPVRPVDELDECETELRSRTAAYDGCRLVERRVHRGVDRHPVDFRDVGD